MPEEDLDRLLAVTAKIAEAVQAFPPEVRQAAYDDMMAAYNGAPLRPVAIPKPSTAPEVEQDGVDAEATDEEIAAPATSRRPRNAAKASSRKAKPKQITPVRDFNFWPDGKQSFPAFVEEKQPANLNEKNLAAVYWLEQVAEVEGIGTGHVLAAFKAAKWREAAHPDTALQVTASRKHWIDTRDMKAITTTHGGRVFVDHEMPGTKTPGIKK